MDEEGAEQHCQRVEVDPTPYRAAMPLARMLAAWQQVSRRGLRKCPATPNNAQDCFSCRRRWCNKDRLGRGTIERAEHTIMCRLMQGNLAT